MIRLDSMTPTVLCRKSLKVFFTAAKIKALEKEFEKNKYILVSKRMQLSKQLKLTETQVLHFTFFQIKV